VPHICPVLADVGFHSCPPVTLYWQQVFMSMVIYTLYIQGSKFVESHICQNRADMGHPSFVTDQAVRNRGKEQRNPTSQKRDVGHPSFAVRLTSPDYFMEELAGLMPRNWARPNLPWMRFSLRQSW
jgi:hypothetical protein